MEDQAYEDPRARPTSVPAEIFKLFLAAMERIFWDREVPQGPVIAAVMIIIQDSLRSHGLFVSPEDRYHSGVS